MLYQELRQSEQPSKINSQQFPEIHILISILLIKTAHYLMEVFLPQFLPNPILYVCMCVSIPVAVSIHVGGCVRA